MRVRARDGRRTILGYCTNVHPIEELGSAIEALARYCGPVRRRLGAPLLSLGLWLSRRAAAALRDSRDSRRRLADALAEQGLELVTLNAFPYGDFHAERVKENVYRPDWSDPRRSEYTLDLARILAELLPADAGEGTISTLPLAYAAWSDGETARRSAEALATLAIDLEKIADAKGRVVRVCLEPEPDCLVESTKQAIEFFSGALRDAGRRLGAGDRALGRHLGLCFDACHQSVGFEDPRAAWSALAAAEIPVGKVQLSCALRVSGASAAALAPFDEPRFLHQVRRSGADPAIEGRSDLGPALAGTRALAREGEWRVHFHAPLHWRPEAGEALGTTVDDLVTLLSAVCASEALPHLEVETYTWGVLPEGLRPRDDAMLVEGIAREIEFVERQLAALGVTRERPA